MADLSACHVSDLLGLAVSIYIDAAAKCTDEPLERERDLLTIRSRVKHEGLSFLTITLPTLGKDFDLCLSKGRIDSTDFRSFKKFGKAPAFLRGFFSRVFDEKGGIHNEPCIAAIEGIRQIAYSFKKLRVACSPKRVCKAMAEYVKIEHVFDVPISQVNRQTFNKVVGLVWNPVFAFDSDIVSRAVPRHGPGSVAEKLSSNAKWKWQRWHERLDKYFPILDFAFANADARLSEEFEKVSLVDEAEEQPVRVIPVPKTLKTPRIIAIEPVCMQYAQQALSKELIKILETYELTSGHINFRDQRVNRRLALSSSKDGKFATLDLSSASDRVPLDLASSMFNSNPDLKGSILACRSTKAQMPDGEIISLRKFASMGSALCFPIEAMYFYTICIIGLLRWQNLPLSMESIRKVKSMVFIYGDDIIIPTDASDIVMHTLQEYLCKVNVRKSFTKGNFRESCGMDAFAGHVVIPTYVKALLPHDKRDAQALVSTLEASNLFYKKGYWQTSATLLRYVESTIGNLPIVGEQCAGLGKISFQRHLTVERLNKVLWRPEVRTSVVHTRKRMDKLDGYGALLKCLLRLDDCQCIPSTKGVNLSIKPDPVLVLDQKIKGKGWVARPMRAPRITEHLEYSVRRGDVTLKRRWVTPY
jgi:hypothetical protein